MSKKDIETKISERIKQLEQLDRLANDYGRRKELKVAYKNEKCPLKQGRLKEEYEETLKFLDEQYREKQILHHCKKLFSTVQSICSNDAKSKLPMARRQYWLSQISPVAQRIQSILALVRRYRMDKIHSTENEYIHWTRCLKRQSKDSQFMFYVWISEFISMYQVIRKDIIS